ncbi:DF family (seleno)protein [Saccharomonospora halophila]|uniref:DF family (seleno)protein n=1 Tax=Saccharomonospora halophila TaxID=129922 RepID=UPI00035D482E|nr:hypothetical protein [Saccharomonospora halophila]
MDVELFYFTGCPNWHLAKERLSEAVTAVGHSVPEITLRAVETDEEARAFRVPGSPTIRVNGHDLFPAAAETDCLACRVYPTPDGLSGAPTVDQLIQALNGASGQHRPLLRGDGPTPAFRNRARPGAPARHVPTIGGLRPGVETGSILP